MCALKRSSIRWLPIIACISAVGISTSSRCAAQVFVSAARFDFQTGPTPLGLAVGDLNGDGVPDLATANWGGNTVSVFLGDGHDGFSAPTSFATGGAPHSVAMGDLNGDGKTDLVVANEGSSSVSILLGNGGGGFAPRTDYSTGSAPYAVAIGDVSGDGKPDLAVANNVANTITVLRGTGLGGFGSRADFLAGARPVSIAIGDLNDDGAADLVSANNSGSSVSVLIGNGAGGFAAKTDFATATGPIGLAIGDLNGDGRLDVTTANYAAGSATFMLGDGLGGLGSRTDFSTGGLPTSIAIGDLNGDGKTDVALPSITNLITVLPGDGSGTFSSKLDFATPSQPKGIAIADINGDGKPDLLSANAGANSLSVLLANNPVAHFLGTSLPTGPGSAVALADFDSDGWLDLAVASDGWRLDLYPGNGSGGFGSNTEIDSYGTVAIVTGDLNGDGNPDVLAVNQPYNTVTCYLGDGLGVLTPSGVFTTGAGPVAAALGDLNGDGKPDLVVANQSDNSISVLLGDGLGGFGTKTDYPPVFGTGPASVALGDLNGDGYLDAAVANSSSNTVAYFLGNGAGQFALRPDLDSGVGPTSIAIGDLDGDGFLDMVAANSGSGTVSVWLGTGNIFGAPFVGRSDIPVAGTLASIAIADLNGDGRLDLVATTDQEVVTLLGDGSGGFSGTPAFYGVGGFPSGVAVGDLNGDGKLDLTVGRQIGGVSVLLASVAAGITLTADPFPPTLGSPFTLMASLSAPPSATDVPSGTVSFFDGTTPIGSSEVNGGTAALSTLSLSLVGHVFSAVYGGDTRFPPAISRGLAISTSLAPHIAGIHDVPNDQGGQVTIQWDASAFDRTPNNPISAYWIWRQVPAGVAMAQMARGATLVRAGESRGQTGPGAILTTIDGAETYYWEYVKSHVAHGFPGYSDLAPTTGDSTAASNPRTRFMVEAEQLSTGLYWSSEPDSGYSVDNLPPSMPAPFTAAYSAGATHLHWGAGSDVDLLFFRLYRGSAAGFVPNVSNRIATTSETGYVDSGPGGRYYKLSAVDTHGNESSYAELGPDETVDVPHAPVTTLYLAPPSPSPTSSGAMFRFGLPREGPVTLALFDQQGRRVRALAKGVLPAGQHRLDWDGRDDAGRAVATGIYFARLEHEGQRLVARLIAIR